MSSIYTKRPPRRNEKPQAEIDGLRIASIIEAIPELPETLTAAGRIIYRRTRRPAPTCNLLATLAGIGPMEAH